MPYVLERSLVQSETKLLSAPEHPEITNNMSILSWSLLACSTELRDWMFKEARQNIHRTELERIESDRMMI